MSKVIGIVGGAGPYAGLDLVRKILEETIAEKDQDHLDMIGLFKPGDLIDRTEYLVNPNLSNPGLTIARQALELERMGAQVVAIPCNTAHAPAIFDVVLEELRQKCSGLIFVNMIQETVNYLKQHYPYVNQVGVLSTIGTRNSGVYARYIDRAGLKNLLLSQELQECVHQAVYDTHYGIKSTGYSTNRAQHDLLSGAHALAENGAEVILLGCTEIPLAVNENRIGSAYILDPTRVLARALIRKAAPDKLKPNRQQERSE